MKRYFRQVAFATLLAATIIFVGCKDEKNEIDTKNTTQKTLVQSDPIPNGYYYGKYYRNDGTTIRITLQIIDNQIVGKWVDGQRQDVKGQELIYGKDNKASQEKSIDLAIKLSEKYPCVATYEAGESFDDPTIIVYAVEWSNDTPCWYEIYYN